MAAAGAGGHCGRADDYHYHIAPVQLEKQVGKGMPIAYALDGYPIYCYTEPTPTSRRLTYEVSGRQGFVDYKVNGDGTLVFDYTDPSGKKTTETYTPRGRGQGGRGGPGPRGEGGRGPRRPGDDRPPPPPQSGPPGTKSYAVTLWHEAPDQVKSYWVVYGIPGNITQLAKNARNVGTTGRVARCNQGHHARRGYADLHLRTRGQMMNRFARVQQQRRPPLPLTASTFTHSTARHRSHA